MFVDRSCVLVRDILMFFWRDIACVQRNVRVCTSRQWWRSIKMWRTRLEARTWVDVLVMSVVVVVVVGVKVEVLEVLVWPW